jgi:hypothetical protein
MNHYRRLCNDRSKDCYWGSARDSDYRRIRVLAECMGQEEWKAMTWPIAAIIITTEIVLLGFSVVALLWHINRA